MFIRKTTTRRRASGEAYSTFRLVASVREGAKVRQQTILNLGSDFDLPQGQWTLLCDRIESILSGQLRLMPLPEDIEALAQRHAASIATGKKRKQETPAQENQEFHDVDINSLELVRPRSVGVEHAALNALKWLNFDSILEAAGLNPNQKAVATASIIGRMAQPGSERRTWNWVREESALGELLDVDFENVPLISFYRVSDQLVAKREQIEQALFSRISSLFSLPTTVTLFDLTNTFFEGEIAGNAKAKHGRSKEKRTDCKLVTLAMALDGSGFVKRSRMFEGNVSEGKTLQEMLADLQAPQDAMVIMDRGIATKDNIAWLAEQGYRYLVVSRERSREFDLSKAETILNASKAEIHVQRHFDPTTGDVYLRCQSARRQAKEEAMVQRFRDMFEAGLAKIAQGLQKPRCQKGRDKIQRRIGRLMAKSRGIGQHYQISIETDPSKDQVLSLTWKLEPVPGTMLTDPGVYCLRTNDGSLDAETLWRTYTMLTDLEAVFRSLKSELGLRPVFHHKEERADGHLFITVLAYQAVQALRRKLKADGVHDSWLSLRAALSVQCRITASFTRRDGRTVHIRKSTQPEPKLAKFYSILALPPDPGGIRKSIHEPRKCKM
jgi:transposase